MTDAIGFLATGDFVSFMSGNTTRLAVAISQGDASLVLRLFFAVLAFIADAYFQATARALGRYRAPCCGYSRLA